MEYVYFARRGSEYATSLVQAEETTLIIPDEGVIITLHPSAGEAVPEEEAIAIFFGE